METCTECGLRVTLGNLAVMANDFCDLRNGRVYLCKSCRNLWREARQTAERWLAKGKPRRYETLLSTQADEAVTEPSLPVMPNASILGAHSWEGKHNA